MRFTLMLKNSKVDTFYRSVLLSKFFIKGWGKPEEMKNIFKFRKILSSRSKCISLVNSHHPVFINKCVEKTNDYNLYEGHFLSPLVNYLPIPQSCRIAKFQIIEPTNEKIVKNNLNKYLKPVVIHLAGTGDHYYWRRRSFMAKPLLEQGITSIILENPYYGVRKPPEQRNSCLLNVSDLFIMGGCLILECLVLLNWLEKQGYGPLGVTGISMGGHMASLAGCSWHKPISIVPCLSWTTASCVFTQGVLSGSIPWDVLTKQYEFFGKKTIKELSELLNSPEESEMFDVGRQFARQYAIKNTNQENKKQENNEKILNSSDYIKKLNKINDNLQDKNNDYNYNESLKNFFYSISFNIYDILNKTLLQSNEKKNTLKDSLNFMRGIMDECTHLGNFDKPLDCELCIIVNASHDGYVPKSNLIPLNELWVGSTLRKIDCGHVTAILFYHKLFQQAIIDSLDLNARKYYNGNIVNQCFLSERANAK